MFKLVVLSCFLAAANAYVVVPAPIAYSAPLFAPSNYRGPLSLAPGQPANVLGSDGRPLDTLEVNIDRSAHYTAKAFEAAGIHVLKKRSLAPIAVAPVGRVAYAGAPVLSRSIATPIAYSAPAVATPIAYAAPWVTPSNYRGPLSLAPGQPANVLGSDGRPLDTLEVNIDRSAHYNAKAFEAAGIHVLKKRSLAPIAVAPVGRVAYAGAPVLSRSIAAPIAYSAPAVATPIAYAAPWVAPSNYRGPLSLAPGQPANVLGSDGRPLDTLEVNIDRSAHYTAKALDGAGIHLVKKRSVVAASPVLTHTVAAPVAYSAAIATPFAYSAYSAPVISPVTYSAPAVVHAW